MLKGELSELSAFKYDDFGVRVSLQSYLIGSVFSVSIKAPTLGTVLKIYVSVQLEQQG